MRLNTRPHLWAAWQSCVGRVFELTSPSLTPEWARTAEAASAADAVAASPLANSPPPNAAAPSGSATGQVVQVRDWGGTVHGVQEACV